ncbi:hypothetical protein EYF80_049378 [Liparis tanakae]|uniref:Uncharacterized protein n=1 Tax=Liparis tanakae TaxID=230148 RepID=A0A4Z2FGY1_9TELE|nr:hypothetical protein EYF80_049378 [Liparis tanakae]
MRSLYRRVSGERSRSQDDPEGELLMGAAGQLELTARNPQLMKGFGRFNSCILDCICMEEVEPAGWI